MTESSTTNQELKPLNSDSPKRWIWGIGVFSMLYALVRYVLFTPELAEQIPSFIVNKAVGMAGSFFLVLGLWCRCRKQLDHAGIYFQSSFFAVVVHIPLSLSLLRPGYFPDFYPQVGTMLNFWGESVVVFGALSLALLWRNSRERLPPRPQHKLGMTLLAVVIAHVGAMGICRGLNIDAKHAYLPPMWLLSLIGLGAGFLAMIRHYWRGM